MNTALVWGLAIAGISTARALARRGYEVLAVDDSVDDKQRHTSNELGIELLEPPNNRTLKDLIARSELVCPAPGVPETHRLIVLAQEAGADLVTELELAYRWEQDRPGVPRPMLGVTGTDGKTTTALLIEQMLAAAGRRSVAAGNTPTPLLDAIDKDHEAFAVECSSFRLAFTPSFRPDAGAWLNFAPDHQNWHRSLESYAAAKAQMWANQRFDDIAVGHYNDTTVRRYLNAAPSRQVTYAARTTGRPTYRVEDGYLVGPGGAIAPVGAMWRTMPHDFDNALAAAALVLETGLVTPTDIERALSTFVGPSHRIEPLGEVDDIAWFNDSKATTPHATRTAILGFERIVLIAGGKDKHVNLAEMATEQQRIKAVVAFGETCYDVARLFDDVATVEVVDTLDQAVPVAAGLARSGDTVLFSPGCASFDQFSSFEARGDRFRELAARFLHPNSRSSDPRNKDAIRTECP